ncbi:MAG: DUF3800 domain-containing protein [Alphaproteobacteria bacterium]|nr:DUF3800 domain-containing protein [Alphaproteobacteria bacterium]
MFICYVDESGVPQPDAGTSHFVLAGVAVPVAKWKRFDEALVTLKGRHKLGGMELHTAWMERFYPEQERIAGFAELSLDQRRSRTRQERKVDLGKAALRGDRAVRSLAKNYAKTDSYIHLSHEERRSAVRDAAHLLGGWEDCVVFADVQRKAATPMSTRVPDPAEAIADHAFEQLVTRFHHFLKRHRTYGIIAYDRNQAMSVRLTNRMRRFHAAGTVYSQIPRIVDTPFFVDSGLTSMIQMADLAAYALRRRLERGEADLFEAISPRFDRRGDKVVGVRHYTGRELCGCPICAAHGRE